MQRMPGGADPGEVVFYGHVPLLPMCAFFLTAVIIYRKAVMTIGNNCCVTAGFYSS